MPEDALSVLQFWFLELMPENWFSSSQELDQQIARRFGHLLVQAGSGEIDHWAETPRGRLALVIVLDQFSRNIHRDTGAAFEQDRKAQELSLDAIENGEDERLSIDERQFLYMPLMHAEDRHLQAICVKKFEALVDRAVHVAGFARKHRDIVERYGRFPYRNPMLGRESTPDERAFIDHQGNPFS
ncbi:DUF924 family protein [uncultured Erythrobacter sp.]|uniref:DUF924 family protein n=1 Tax=uncultured Erythrobacter sp. TaxID=263913 RepID=UPI002618CEF3|nr:DUF924 family protein [uncultured Erythrobacter sp.]